MGRDDWYRRSKWSKADENEFRARLERSRSSFHKAQYLRIQAQYLADAGHHRPAIQLLDEIVSDYPERSQLALAHLQKAGSLAALGDITQATDEYRASLEVERQYTNIKTGCWLQFPWFIVQNQLIDLYDEALDVLQKFDRGNSPIFPAGHYCYAAVNALILSARGDSIGAHKWASEAIEHANTKHSGFLYHPDIGLVKSLDQTIHKRLVKLAK